MSFEQNVALIILAACVVLGIFLKIESYGGWPIFWYDLKQQFLPRKER